MASDRLHISLQTVGRVDSFRKTNPPALKTFLCWLLDDVAYDTVNKDHTIPTEKLRKCMALAETIVSINKNSFTPFSLGLALQMHQVYGSNNRQYAYVKWRQLCEVLDLHHKQMKKHR
jgi:hypothetical protein